VLSLVPLIDPIWRARNGPTTLLRDRNGIAQL
jgi:hypothetical protein